MDIKETKETRELRRRYDEACKRLLAHKEILAQILKACVEEFQDCNVYDIADKYIEGTPEISEENVHSDEAYTNIVGMNTEDSSVDEGTVKFDVLFRARIPGSDDEIGLIINIEAQNKYNVGYPLIKRGIYYCSRLISSQYKRYFEKSHYEKLKKVYSIWIVINTPKERQNTVTRYKITEQNIIGKFRESKVNYDLMNVVMVCLGDREHKDYTGILKFLDVLFKSHLRQERQEVLVDEFGLRYDSGLQSEVSGMCNLSEGVLELGIERGIEQGIERGIEQGIEQGIRQGVVQGVELGKAEAKENMIINAYNMKLDIEQMQGLTGLTREEIRGILKSRGYDI